MGFPRRALSASFCLVLGCSAPADPPTTSSSSDELARARDDAPIFLTASCQYRPDASCCPAGDAPANGARRTSEACHVAATNASAVVGTSGSDFLALGAGDPAHTVRAGAGGDAVVGGEGADRLELGAGDDTGAGGPGDDLILGQAGSDRLLGEEGDDRLFGHAGNDVLVGGAGRDRLYAGAGDDTLVIRDACEVAQGELYAGGPGRDVLVTPLDLRQLAALGVVVRDIEEVRIDTTQSSRSECQGGAYTALPLYDVIAPSIARDGSFRAEPSAILSLGAAAQRAQELDYELTVTDPQGRVVRTFPGVAPVAPGQTRIRVSAEWIANVWNDQLDGEYTYDIKPPGPKPSDKPGLGKFSLSIIVASPTKEVCVVIGHGSFNESPWLPLYGTDLGMPVSARTEFGTTKNFVFFGDTWQSGIVPPVGNDDAFATFTAATPASCIKLNLGRVVWAGSEQFFPITVPGQTLGALKTVGTAFAVNHHDTGPSDLYALYSNPEFSDACSDKAPLQLIHHTPAFLGGGYAGPMPLFEQITKLASNAGYGIPGCPLHRFVNLASATTATADGATEYVYVWGRASFWSVKGDAALTSIATDTFLLRIPNWDPSGSTPTFQFWAGPGTWTNSVALAKPVITGEAQHTVNQMSVTYDAGLKRWLMLYGGRAPTGDELGGMGGPPDPSLGIYLRTALAPEGPWTEPITLWAPAASDGFCKQLYAPGAGPGCLPSDVIVLPPPSIKDQYGAEYGAQLLPDQTTTAPDGGRTIRWLVSTWNPYHVIEMETTIKQVITLDP